ncbi:MAG TPA: orotidine-5'-phosphate decarboxylase [Solirubrobacteraceae bacterium]|nr:orotidine-5'-phosphate decarboxylase [Solirubrobacteraceae bacterium]
MSERFAGRLGDAVARRESQIVLGLDPDPAALWPAAGGVDGPALARHCRAVIAAAGGACVAIKPQLACFERLGAAGWAALEETVAAAHEADLLVIADGKRGDVPVTAAAYAQALSALGADAFTANPLLGRDSLEPLVASGCGVFVLVRTSNRGAADVQDLELAAGGPLWERLARLVDELAGAGDGLSDVGAVLGATRPEHLERARELMPRSVFLLPGVGAQGGRVEDLAAAFAPGRAAGLITASRAIVNAHLESGAEPASAAAAQAEALRATAWSLSD